MSYSEIDKLGYSGRSNRVRKTRILQKAQKLFALQQLAPRPSNVTVQDPSHPAHWNAEIRCEDARRKLNFKMEEVDSEWTNFVREYKALQEMMRTTAIQAVFEGNLSADDAVKHYYCEASQVQMLLPSPPQPAPQPETSGKK